ncbi:MAG TPA: ferritin family protein [Deltaproteobacteria bacterium]|nr:ferritin family protein [Deltaproteobacteria bacterium]
MSFDTFEEIIRYAMEKEEEAVAFYEEASSLEPYAWAKETFEGFAKEEQKHKTLLEGFLKGEKLVTDYKFEWVTDIKRSDYLVDMAYEKGMSYPDVLRLAMKREEKALAFYNELQKRPGGEELMLVFKMLAQEEAKHKLALEKLYDDFMAEQGD